VTVSGEGDPRGGRTGRILVLWMAAVVGLHAVSWLGGARTAALDDAVEAGAARTERARIAEVGDDLVRKAVRMQQATRPFWKALALVADFVVGPLALVARALAAAAIFSSLAALVGRPPGFSHALAENAGAQRFWVLGLAVRVGLATALRRNDAETSLTLAIPPGTYPASAWVALSQFDAFALLGWAAVARGAWRRGQANLATATAVCILLWIAEAALRTAGTLATGAGMRLTLIPEL